MQYLFSDADLQKYEGKKYYKMCKNQLPKIVNILQEIFHVDIILQIGSKTNEFENEKFSCTKKFLTFKTGLTEKIITLTWVNIFLVRKRGYLIFLICCICFVF